MVIKKSFFIAMIVIVSSGFCDPAFAQMPTFTKLLPTILKYYLPRFFIIFIAIPVAIIFSVYYIVYYRSKTIRDFLFDPTLTIVCVGLGFAAYFLRLKFLRYYAFVEIVIAIVTIYFAFPGALGVRDRTSFLQVAGGL
jgi:hypothetical protein